MNEMTNATSLLDPEVMQNPFPLYQWAHANSPVIDLPGTGMKVIMGFDMCSEAAGRVEDFSNAFGLVLSGAMAEDTEVGAILAEGWPGIDTLLTADPPVHTRFRKLVNLAFSMPRVNALEDGIRDKVNRLIDGFADKGECDFVEAFSVGLPVQVICEQLGFAPSEWANVKRWSDAFADRLGHMISREREIECAHTIVEYQRAIKLKIDERRANPTDDLLSDVVNARLEGETPLDDAEIMSIAQQLMVAGNETTTHALAGGIVHLANNPEQQAKARANPALIPNMVEEVLRLDTPTAGMWRVVMRDCELGGHEFKAGSMVMLRYASANRDPAKYPDPDKFDVERSNARTHLAFGQGPHFCIGAALARSEARIAFEQLVDRATDWTIDGDVPEPTRRELSMTLRGLSALHLTFRKAQP